jgi:hypothetical protein
MAKKDKILQRCSKASIKLNCEKKQGSKKKCIKTKTNKCNKSNLNYRSNFQKQIVNVSIGKGNQTRSRKTNKKEVKANAASASGGGGGGGAGGVSNLPSLPPKSASQNIVGGNKSSNELAKKIDTLSETINKTFQDFSKTIVPLFHQNNQKLNASTVKAFNNGKITQTKSSTQTLDKPFNLSELEEINEQSTKPVQTDDQSTKSVQTLDQSTKPIQLSNNNHSLYKTTPKNGFNLTSNLVKTNPSKSNINIQQTPMTPKNTPMYIKKITDQSEKTKPTSDPNLGVWDDSIIDSTGNDYSGLVDDLRKLLTPYDETPYKGYDSDKFGSFFTGNDNLQEKLRNFSQRLNELQGLGLGLSFKMDETDN